MTFATSPSSGVRRTPQAGDVHSSDLATDDTIRIVNTLEETQVLVAAECATDARTQTPRTETKEANDVHLRRQVRTVLAGMYPLNVPHARRQEERFPYPRLLQLTPANASGKPEGAEVTVVGKQLSEHGLGFFHPGPLPHRWVIVQLEVANGKQYSFLLQLLWCRFLREGWYESGGRFSRLIETQGE